MDDSDGHDYKDYRYGDDLEELDTVRERVRGIEGLIAIAMSELRKERFDDSKERIQLALEHVDQVKNQLEQWHGRAGDDDS